MSGPGSTRLSAPRIGLAFLATLVPVSALAHSGAGVHLDFIHGLQHPLVGLDHLLVMLGVGFFAATLGQRARWVLPMTFVTTMALTAFAAMIGALGGAPAEHWIALSVIAIGVPIALALQPGLPWAMALVALCAGVHGHAHGVELPVAADASVFMLGLVLSTALVHATGALAGLGLNRISCAGVTLTRGAGAAIALAGLGLSLA